MRAVLLVLGLLAATSRPADACSCKQLQPCEAFWAADVVFTGVVTDVVTQARLHKAADGKLIIGGPTQSATLTVDEKLSGIVSDTMTVDAGGMCTLALVNGERYFIYANRDGQKLALEGCGRSRRLVDAADDLAYAHALPKRKLGVVEGEVRRTSDDNSGEYPLAPGVTVRVVGGKLASAPTDARGRFRLDVPPGTHALDVVAAGYRLEGLPRTVTIANPAACAVTELAMIRAGRARGRLIDHLGKPAGNIDVFAHSTTGPWTRFARTKPDGSYEIEDIPPGITFSVGVRGPDVKQPIPSTFYPGTPAGRAKAVTLPATGIADKLDFALPAPLAVHTSTGIVRDKRGPLARTYVTISGDRLYEYIETDDAGRFAVRHLAGEITFEACIDLPPARNRAPAADPVCAKVVKLLDKPSAVDIVIR
jgi:hypothetical protein